MQHLKLSIPSLNQSFLYSGNFKEMSYKQLISYAESRLGRVLPLEFQFFYINSEGIQFVVDSDEQLENLQGQNQQVIKIILKEKEKEKVFHPNTICSRCQSSPIMNARYKCIVCENLEFCENCLDHGQVHPLLIISKPEQEQFFDGFFKTSMNKVKNLFNCQYNLKEVLLKKKSELFGENKKDHQIQQINLEHKQLQQKQEDEQQSEDVLNKTLRLTEIFEGSPEKFEKIVKQNQHLQFEELVELISDQILDYQWNYTQETNFSTKCGCHICLFCLLNWFEEKNRDKPVEILKCPNQECHFTYTRAEILSFCSQQPYERMIQEILLKEYLKNQEIRPCPNGKCKYFGYIELENKCDDELECLECGIKWRDFALASYTFQTEYLLKNIFGIIREFCYCFITTNECPECGVLIQRNGGCKHMTCKACAHQFCWFCKQQWGRHKESQCFSSQAISIVLLLTFPINVLHQFGIFYYFLYIFYPLYLILELLTINVIVIGTGFGIFFFFKSIFDLMNLRRRTCENVITFGASILLFIIDYFVLWFSTVFLDITFQKAFVGFLIEISIGIIVIGYLNRVGFRWIFLPIIGIFQFYYFGLNGLIMLIWQIPVIVGERNFFSQIGFNLIALGLMVLYNIFSLSELFSSLPLYLLLGYTYFHYRTNSQKSNVAFVGILAISYLYEIIFA